jgi:hypothetical protein
VIKQRYVCMAGMGSIAISAIGLGGYNGGAQQPLVKIVWYYHTHLAVSENAVR